MLSTPMYRSFDGTRPNFTYTLNIGELEPTNGLVGGGLPLTSPPVIDLAWGPDLNLYGVTNALPAGQDANALFRIDTTTGTATRIGGIGLQLPLDGDLATDPRNGRIYGVDGNRLFAFRQLTPTSASSAATLIGQPVPLQPGWHLIGLAFNSAGTLFAIAQPFPTGGPGQLLRLNTDTGAIVGSPINLTRTFGNIGGMEFIGTRLFFAEGYRPGPTVFQGSGGESLYEINSATGAVQAPGGPVLYENGVASLVSCRPQIQICRQPPPDMVAWYPLDGNANDRILGNNAIPSGPVNYAAAKVGQGISFYNGGYLTVPPGPILNQGLGDFSLDFWIVVLPETLTGGTRTVIDKRSSGAGGYRGWALFMSNGRLGLQLADGGYSNYYDSTQLMGGYRHIALTVDRDNPQGIRFYVDGVPRPPLNPTARQGNLDNNAPAYIGRHSFDSELGRWMRLDELQFFDRVLTPQEVFTTWEAQGNGHCKI